jgi:flagellar M-ring protein FliF
MPLEDASELSTVLAGRGIPQRVGAGGRTVLVPAERLAEARLAAASAGLPRGGVGFELFEGASLGQSSFAEQVNYRRALQGELARSIAALAPVEGARVHVALGKRSVFKDADEPPSASVALRVRPGARLTPDQVRGVMQLVAASIDGLDADKVVVVDQHGEVLSGAERDQATDQGTLETTIAARVRAILERVVGPGHVAVVASIEMDRRRVSQSEEIFDKDKVAVRSETHVGTTATTGTAISGGIAGVQGNLPGAPAASGGGAGTSAGSGSTTTNYEVSRVIRQIDEPAEKVARLHLAILVDHRPDEDGELQPLPQEELDQLAQLARNAAGFKAERGDALEIRSFAFVPDESTAPAPAPKQAGLPVPTSVIGGGVAAVVIIAFLLMRKRGRHRATPTLALPAPVAELERVLATRERDHDRNALAALPPPGPSPERTLEERVLGAVRSDLPRTARVLSSWLSEPDPKAAKS